MLGLGSRSRAPRVLPEKTELAPADLPEIADTEVQAVRDLAESPRPPAEVLQALPAAGDVYGHVFAQLGTRTKHEYRQDLEQFATFLHMPSGADAVRYFLSLPGDQAQAVALGWVQDMEARGLSASTQTRRLSALRSMVRRARDFGHVRWSISVKVKKARLGDVTGHASGTSAKLLAVCGEGLPGLRNQILVRLFSTFPLRRSEVSQAKVKHYERPRLSVYGKGWERDENKIRSVILPPKVADLIDAWLEQTGPRDPEDSLLYGWKNNHRTAGLTGAGIYSIFDELRKRAGIDEKIRPHKFRHDAANKLIGEGEDLVTIQSLLGHEDPKTTNRYFDNKERVAHGASLVLERLLDGEEAATKKE